MSARDLTRDGLVRALSAAVTGRAAVDAVLAGRAESMARRADRQGLEARIVRRGAARYAVELTGPGLLSRAFGSLDAPADDAVADIIDEGGAP